MKWQSKTGHRRKSTLAREAAILATLTYSPNAPKKVGRWIKSVDKISEAFNDGFAFSAI